MKSFHCIIRNIIFLIVIVVLIGITINLARNRTLQLNALSQTISTPITEIVATPQEPASTKTAATKTPTPRVYFATPIAGPTYTPTPPIIPSATFEPLRGQAIGGYVFSEARLVPNTLGHYIVPVEWIPDEPDKLLIMRDTTSLEVIDVNTGETQLYSDGVTPVKNPVWLSERGAAAYLTIDEQDRHKQYLWISQGTQKEGTLTAHPVLTTSWLSPLVVTPDGNGVILFDADWQLAQVGANTPRSVKLARDTQDYAPRGYGYGGLYQMAQSVDRTKAVYFNYDHLLLADFTTGSLTPIDLDTLRTKDMPPVSWVYFAAWNPKGDELALSVAEELTAGSSSNLFILDLASSELSFIEDGLQYVGNLVWSPDGIQILIFPSVRTREDGYGRGGLFLIDINSKEVRPIAALPNNDAIVSAERLLWAPKGHYVAVVFADEPENPGLYIIDVEKP